MMKISQQVTKVFASDCLNWKNELAEIAVHTHGLVDSFLSDGYDFDDLDDAIAIAIYEDRPQTALPRHKCSVAGCLLREDMMNCALPCWRGNAVVWPLQARGRATG
jgi:hypothetical protein